MDARNAGLSHGARSAAIQNVLRDAGKESREVFADYGRSGIARKTLYNVTPEAPYRSGRWTFYPLRIENTEIVPWLVAAATARKLAVALNTQGVAVRIEGNTALVMVPDAASSVLTYAEAVALDDGPLAAGTLILGREVTGGQRVAIDTYAERNVHAVVVGTTGTGKSTTLRTLAFSALEQGVGVALFDPRAGPGSVETLGALSGHPCVWRGGVWNTAARCEAGLALLARQVERGESEGHLLVFVDEVPALVAERPGIRDRLGVIAASGRHIGAHLYLGAQHATSELIGGLTGINAPLRLIHSVTTRQAAYQAAGEGLPEARKLGRGELIATNALGQWHVQVAIVPDPDLHTFMVRYPPRIAREPVTVPIIMPGEPGQIGRPMDDIDAAVVEAIREYHVMHEDWPSLGWIRKWTLRRYRRNGKPTGYGREKQRAALEIARGLPVPEREVAE